MSNTEKQQFAGVNVGSFFGEEKKEDRLPSSSSPPACVPVCAVRVCVCVCVCVCASAHRLRAGGQGLDSRVGRRRRAWVLCNGIVGASWGLASPSQPQASQEPPRGCQAFLSSPEMYLGTHAARVHLSTSSCPAPISAVQLICHFCSQGVPIVDGECATALGQTPGARPSPVGISL